MEQVKAIDVMCRPFYCRPEEVKPWFEYYEYQVLARTTFGGVTKRLGLKPGEEWKALVMNSKSSVKEMLAEMDEIGVEYVLMDQCMQWSRHHHTYLSLHTIETIVDIMREAGGRVIGGIGYNPFEIKESLERLETVVKDFGFKYVWAHPITFGVPLSDKKMYPLYMKAIELGIPITMQVGHSAEPLPSELGHPMYADEAVLDFPDLTLVLTHTGWPWIDEWMSMVWKHPNVYGNIGAYFPSSLDPSLVSFMDGRGRDKVMWATNGFGLTRCLQEFMELPIRDESKKKILRDNAIKVFKLDVDEPKK